jgi:hypothetical protein
LLAAPVSRVMKSRRNIFPLSVEDRTLHMIRAVCGASGRWVAYGSKAEKLNASIRFPLFTQQQT